MTRVLHQEKASGPEGGEHAGQCSLRVGEMEQQCPAVDEVVGAVLEVVDEDVVAAHLQVRTLEVGQEAWVEVGGDDVALFADVGGQPPGHRPCARPDLEAAGAVQRPEGCDPADGPLVKA